MELEKKDEFINDLRKLECLGELMINVDSRGIQLSGESVIIIGTQIMETSNKLINYITIENEN